MWAAAQSTWFKLGNIVLWHQLHTGDLTVRNDAGSSYVSSYTYLAYLAGFPGHRSPFFHRIGSSSTVTVTAGLFTGLELSAGNVSVSVGAYVKQVEHNRTFNLYLSDRTVWPEEPQTCCDWCLCYFYFLPLCWNSFKNFISLSSVLFNLFWASIVCLQALIFRFFPPDPFFFCSTDHIIA